MKKIILFSWLILSFLAAQNLASAQDYDIYTVAYVQRIQNKVSTNWIFPHGKTDSKAVVVFKINKDGKIINANIANKSGDEEFDQNALNAIYKSSPFENIPQNIKDDNVIISFTFSQNEFEATSISEMAADENNQKVYLDSSTPVLYSKVSATKEKTKTRIKTVKPKIYKIYGNEATHGYNTNITPKSIGAGALSLLIWPGLGQFVNDGPSEKAGTHAFLGLINIFRIWSCYDAVVDRKGGVWEDRI